MSIIGSVMALANFVMAPATAGLSLDLSVGGVAFVLAGGGGPQQAHRLLTL